MAEEFDEAAKVVDWEYKPVSSPERGERALSSFVLALLV